MKSEFQDVFKDAYDHWIDDACSHRYNASKSLALQVWQHQQSKIDELQKQRDSFIKAYEIEIDKSDGLQKENAALVHVIKSRDIQLENEKHEYDELMNKLVDSGMKNAELQRKITELEEIINENNKHD